MTYREHVREFKRRLLAEYIERLGVKGTALELQINRTRLHSILIELDIPNCGPFSRYRPLTLAQRLHDARTN